MILYELFYFSFQDKKSNEIILFQCLSFRLKQIHFQQPLLDSVVES